VTMSLFFLSHCSFKAALIIPTGETPKVELEWRKGISKTLSTEQLALSKRLLYQTLSHPHPLRCTHGPVRKPRPLGLLSSQPPLKAQKQVAGSPGRWDLRDLDNLLQISPSLRSELHHQNYSLRSGLVWLQNRVQQEAFCTEPTILNSPWPRG
jgi:hypothetical protein